MPPFWGWGPHVPSHLSLAPPSPRGEAAAPGHPQRGAVGQGLPRVLGIPPHPPKHSTHSQAGAFTDFNLVVFLERGEERGGKKKKKRHHTPPRSLCCMECRCLPPPGPQWGGSSAPTETPAPPPLPPAHLWAAVVWSVGGRSRAPRPERKAPRGGRGRWGAHPRVRARRGGTGPPVGLYIYIMYTYRTGCGHSGGARAG